MDDDRAPTSEEIRRRYTASLDQLERMFIRRAWSPTTEAEHEAPEPVDNEELDAELDELEDELLDSSSDESPDDE